MGSSSLADLDCLLFSLLYFVALAIKFDFTLTLP